MARHLDRRVQRTRKSLQDSLMALILEEGYDEISIQDITEKANLGRATFYLHFKDKDELLLEVMNQLIVDFMDQAPQLTEAQWHLKDTKTIVKLFDFAAANYDLYRILTIGSGGITASRQLHHSIAENIKGFIQAELDTLNAEPVLPVDFIANHFSGSLLATIYWWLDNDLPYTAEEMATMFQKINLVDRDNLLDIKQPDAAPETQPAKRKKRTKDKPHKTKAEVEIDPNEITQETINAVDDESA
ncbi:MAG: TetR/AcrR family transcriptional regulator [Brevefilum sp.]|nr:TetR/AcrR family transcriptional regulator [Brevefilum sp.]